MKTSTIALALLHLAGFSYAASGSSPINARQESSNNVTFYGAGSNPLSFEQSFPANGSLVKIGRLPRIPARDHLQVSKPLILNLTIDNSLQVSRIFNGGPGPCYFISMFNSITVVEGDSSSDLDSPVTLDTGACLAVVL
ncbi:hypothetical protein BDR22DRAFT_858971 [Usnea florida]